MRKARRETMLGRAFNKPVVPPSLASGKATANTADLTSALLRQTRSKMALAVTRSMSCPEITGGCRRKTTDRHHAIRIGCRRWPRVAVQRNSKLAEPEGGFDPTHDTGLTLSPARCALCRTYWSLATKYFYL